MKKLLLICLLLLSWQSLSTPRHNLWTPSFYESMCSLGQYTIKPYADNEEITIYSSFKFAGKSFKLTQVDKKAGLKKEEHVLEFIVSIFNSVEFSDPNYPVNITLDGLTLERLEHKTWQVFHLKGEKVDKLINKLIPQRSFKITVTPFKGKPFEVTFDNSEFKLAKEMYSACVANVT